ncbi:MAG: hypothetical protein ACK5RL_05640 [Acidimicrobiales bacterium]
MTDTGEQAPIEPRSAESSPLPFSDLDAPQPIRAAPPASARWLAFGSIIIGGVLGAMIGYGTADVMAESSVAAAVGALLGGVVAAAGVGVVAGLTLRAMNEWHSVSHPEATPTENRRSRLRR